MNVLRLSVARLVLGFSIRNGDGYKAFGYYSRDASFIKHTTPRVAFCQALLRMLSLEYLATVEWLLVEFLRRPKY